jgi:hypothetical protein
MLQLQLLMFSMIRADNTSSKKLVDLSLIHPETRVACHRLQIVRQLQMRF